MKTQIELLKESIDNAVERYNKLQSDYFNNNKGKPSKELWSEAMEADETLKTIKPYVLGGAKKVTWIKVEEKLPREKQRVMVKGTDGVISIVTYLPGLWENVTHWKHFRV